MLTGFFTEVGKRPVNDVAASSKTGPATVILAGVSVGFESAVYSALLIASAVFGAFLLGGGNVVLSSGTQDLIVAAGGATTINRLLKNPLPRRGRIGFDVILD